MELSFSELIKRPDLAWEPWQPSDQEAWDLKRVCFLMRRSGFGATEAHVRSLLEIGPQQVVSQLMKESTAVDLQSSFERESQAIASSLRASGDVSRLASWWLHRMLHSPTPLVEKMTLFWHGHFATGAEKVQDIDLMYVQNQRLRQHCLGDFRKMVHEISKDPAMLIYLDSATNRKAHANENYARELMELFCLGEGQYTETDVKELAKCFTGWEVRRKQFRFNPYQHDESTKSILGTSGIRSGEEAIDVVLASEQMPRFIAYKLYKFFVCDEPEPTPELLEPLAKVFVQSHFQIATLVQTILGSRLLLSGCTLGRRIRSPIELIVEFLRATEGTTNLTKLADRLKPLGQSLFYPPNVKGWPGGRAWINSSTLIGRANLLYDVMHDENTKFAGTSLNQFVRTLNLSEDERWLNWLSSMLLATELAPSERQTILDRVQQMPAEERTKQTIVELAKLPRIHVS